MKNIKKYLDKTENYIEKHAEKMPHLPQETRKSLADIWPVLVLFAGVIHLFFAWWLYEWARQVDTYVGLLRDTTYGINVTKTGLGFWVWSAILILFINAILLIIAFPKLQKRLKVGWDLVLVAALINLVYGFINLFIEGRGGFLNVIGILIGSAISFYLLFEIREYFDKSKVKVKK